MKVKILSSEWEVPDFVSGDSMTFTDKNGAVVEITTFPESSWKILWGIIRRKVATWRLR